MTNRASARSKARTRSMKLRISALAHGEPNVSDAGLGLTMLALIVIVIMMGFPTAFTLMGLGMMFGFVAFYDPAHSWAQNKVFDLMVERTYGAMTRPGMYISPQKISDA